MKRVSLRQAKAQLSRLLKEVALGEGVVLLRGAEPVALWVPYRAKGRKRRFKGRLRIGEDFDASLPPEMAQAFGPRLSLWRGTSGFPLGPARP